MHSPRWAHRCCFLRHRRCPQRGRRRLLGPPVAMGAASGRVGCGRMCCRITLHAKARFPLCRSAHSMAMYMLFYAVSISSCSALTRTTSNSLLPPLPAQPAIRRALQGAAETVLTRIGSLVLVICGYCAQNMRASPIVSSAVERRCQGLQRLCSMDAQHASVAANDKSTGAQISSFAWGAL